MAGDVTSAFFIPIESSHSTECGWVKVKTREGSLGDTASHPKINFSFVKIRFFGLGLCRPMKAYQRIISGRRTVTLAMCMKYSDSEICIIKFIKWNI